MNNFENLKQLSEDINNIDTYFEMSDSSSVCEKEHKKVKQLVQNFNKLENKEELVSLLSERGLLNFKRYFKMI